MHVSPCSWALRIYKNISIRTYFGPVTVGSGGFPTILVFLRKKSKLVIFLIASIKYIFSHTSSELYFLATLDFKSYKVFTEPSYSGLGYNNGSGGGFFLKVKRMQTYHFFYCN